MILIVSGSREFDAAQDMADALATLNGADLGPKEITGVRVPEARHGAEALAVLWAANTWMPLEVVALDPGELKANKGSMARLLLHQRIARMEPRAGLALFFGKDDVALHLAGVCRARGIRTQWAPAPPARKP